MNRPKHVTSSAALALALGPFLLAPSPAQQPQRTPLPNAVAPADPAAQGETLTPPTLHHGVEGTGPEIDSDVPDELTEDPAPGFPGDSFGTRPLPPQLLGDPYRLAFVGGDYTPAPGERVDPALARAIQYGEVGTTTYGFVMFQGRITSEKRRAVESLGVRLGDHHTFNSMTAVIPVDAISALSRSWAVRWIGYARAFQKIEPALWSILAADDEQTAVRRCFVKVHDSDMTPDARRVQIAEGDASGGERAVALPDFAVIPEGPFQRALEDAGATVLAYHDELRLFWIEAPLRSVGRFVARDFVHYVELDDRILPAHDRSTRQIGIDYIRSLSSNDGSDTVVGMMDSGMDVTHVDTQVKWYAGWGYDGQSPWIDSTGHGTHVMGTIMSPGIGNDRFRGCAPAVGVASNRRIYIAAIFNGPSPNSSANNAIAAFSRFATPITINGVTTPIPSVVNHSWGVGTLNMPQNGWVGTDSLSLALDYRVFQNRQTHVVAAHNQGGSDYDSQTLRRVLKPAVAKLSLTVANCLSARETDGSLPGRPHFSSNKGPTGDGRLCPQIMAPGRGIGSVQAGSGNGYVSFNGTSMATPHVVGTIAGMHDHYSWMKGSPAATRAVLAATSNPYEGSRSWAQNSDRYYNRQGFGQVDAYKAHYQRDAPGGFLAGRWYGTITSATTGVAVELEIPADAVKTNFVLAFDEKPASQGAARSCVHDCDLWIDVEPFTPGYNTGEYASTRAWDTWDWYQNIASIPNVRGKRVRLKIHPRVRPTGGDVVRYGLAYMIPRGDVTPSGSVSVSASDNVVQPGDTIDLTATVSVPEYVQSNSFLWLSTLNGFDVTGLTFRDRENLLRTFSGSSTPENWTLGLQGYWFGSSHRRLQWTLRAPNSNGYQSLCTRLEADNRQGTYTACTTVCVDGQAPNQIQGLTSLSHVPNVWSNTATMHLVWNQASDTGCAGLDGLGYRFSLGGTQVPPQVNLGPNETQLFSLMQSSTQTQFFTLRPFDRAGNATLHVFAGPFLIDLHDPQVQSVVIDGGATHTTDLTVDVVVTASDAHSGVARMRHSMDGATWSPWVAYSNAPQAVDLSTFGGDASEGVKTVWFEVEDQAGNVDSGSDRITYERCPQLRRIVGATTLDNVTKDFFHVAGVGLANITAVQFGPTNLTSTSPLDWAQGYYQIVDNGNMRVFPPQALAPGSYPITVRSRLCRSNALTVSLACTTEPTLQIADQVVAGQGFEVFATPGPLSDQTLIGLALSGSNLPSVLPGVVSLSIGNQFQELVIVPVNGTVDPATCSTTFTLPSPQSLQGATLHFQSYLIDPQAQNPLPAPTTNVATVVFL